MIGVQWFYRPEDVAVDGDGKYQSDDARELFYSFHTDEVPAESVKHKCDVFLYNSNRNGKELLSFNVKGVYFHDRKQLYKLTGKVDRDGKQQECNLSSYGRLTNRDKFSKYLLETLLSPMFNQHNDKQENAGSDVPTAGHNFNDLNQINKSHMDIHQDVEPEKGGSDVRSLTASYRNGASNSLDISPHKTQNDEVSMEWFGKAILAAAHLEEAVHYDLSMDACKYNKKMRQLIFNFKKTARLALRLLNGELAPGKILTMTPNELKAGLTEEEMPSKEPEKPTHSQNPTVDKCCERCPQKKVALKSVPGPISSLTSYKLECVACGWFTVVKDYVPNI